MIKFSPSILSADFTRLGEELSDHKEVGIDYIHVDIMDGHFVPNLSMGVPVVKSLRKLPDLVLDVHLMIDTPIKYAETFCKAGADILTIHVEADTPENIRKTLELIRDCGVKPGLSIKPGTPAEAVLPYLDILDLVLVMTVEPGFGGQSFMEDMMPKLAQIRTWIDEKRPGCDLEVDGGVNEKTAKICTANGADVLVAGSAYFGAPDRAAFVKAIKA